MKTAHETQSGKVFLRFPLDLEITPTAGNHYFLWKTSSEEPAKTINLTEVYMSIENRGAAYISCDLGFPEITIWTKFRTADPNFRRDDRAAERPIERPSDRAGDRPIERPSDWLVGFLFIEHNRGKQASERISPNASLGVGLIW